MIATKHTMTIGDDLGPVDHTFEATMLVLDTVGCFGSWLTQAELSEIDEARSRYLASHDALMAEVVSARRDGLMRETIVAEHLAATIAAGALAKTIFERVQKMRRAKDVP